MFSVVECYIVFFFIFDNWQKVRSNNLNIFSCLQCLVQSTRKIRAFTRSLNWIESIEDKMSIFWMETEFSLLRGFGYNKTDLPRKIFKITQKPLWKGKEAFFQGGGSRLFQKADEAMNIRLKVFIVVSLRRNSRQHWLTSPVVKIFSESVLYDNNFK